MNKKQQMIKKMAKRAKAKSNKVVQPNPSSKPKERYISKAEREKIAAEEAAKQTDAPITTEES
ncbi:DUF2986 domain-containing protein [Shewanella intestini]|uniref:DUF2986 domain-containing protein n=1 Tax=Shewanella intestini TaxID=2017544 RepID=A0ABS5I662_9GAMM|nr:MULTISPECIES: DUF2986 domain-containing protein [Shewanella]MBR9729508.1 DUF2986 domain-containing protein [Shewanella intestini]MRG37563.1 DUF2986 domain-containing protein [Shewanella sp. XMDDZSB0408]